MRHFCTLFNSVYKFHARLLYESICENENVENLNFYFFCFDDESVSFFKNLRLKNVNVISLQELEEYLPDLKKVKPDRSFIEYFFTSTPAICKYVLENYPTVDEIVYLDADLFFFQSPERMFQEIRKASVSIIPHRFNALNYYKNVFGYYNVGWISFKRDENGLACLNNWYGNTIEWCFDKLTFKRYADQKYLNYWRKEFKGIHVIKNKGANVAPWNVGNYKVSIKNKQIYVDETPLIFYHFASLKFIDGVYYTTVSSYLSFLRKEVVNLIYQPYILRLQKLGFVPGNTVRRRKKSVMKRVQSFIRRFYKDAIVVEKTAA